MELSFSLDILERGKEKHKKEGLKMGGRSIWGLETWDRECIISHTFLPISDFCKEIPILGLGPYSLDCSYLKPGQQNTDTGHRLSSVVSCT